MSENCTHDCSNCAEECGSRTEPQSFLAPQNSMSNIKKVIGIVSGKGGVGKTTICANIGYELSKFGKRVVLIDADIGLNNLAIPPVITTLTSSLFNSFLNLLTTPSIKEAVP